MKRLIVPNNATRMIHIVGVKAARSKVLTHTVVRANPAVGRFGKLFLSAVKKG